MPPFTAHNIRFEDGTCTMPGGPPILEESALFKAAVRMLRLVFPQGLEGKSIADLGCLEGGYATGFARLGMTSTGFDAREANVENCRYVADKVKLPNLSFARDDVKNIDRYAPFDAIWACGIYYHIENPRALMEKLSTACKRLLLLHTHFTYNRLTPGAEYHRLSDLCEHERLMGRWFEESKGSQEEHDNALWASWKNPRSFWIQKEHLLDLMQRVGFDIVIEQYDWLSPILGGMSSTYHSVDRGFFIGIKT